MAALTEAGLLVREEYGDAGGVFGGREVDGLGMACMVMGPLSQGVAEWLGLRKLGETKLYW